MNMRRKHQEPDRWPHSADFDGFDQVLIPVLLMFAAVAVAVIAAAWKALA